MTRSRIIVAVLFLCLVVAVFAVKDRFEGRATEEQGRDFAVTEFPAGDRLATRPFAGELLDGRAFESSELDGQVVVLNTWGSWCAPCRTEAGALAEVARETEGEVAFLGINVRDNPDSARAFERRYEMPYPSIRDSDADAVLLALGGALTWAAIPSTVVLDDEGRVAARIIGATTASTLRAVVQAVLAESKADPQSG